MTATTVKATPADSAAGPPMTETGSVTPLWQRWSSQAYWMIH
ncbi:hypothetical protein ABZT43_47670 [Streptomyces sp. NPDC005349]